MVKSKKAAEENARKNYVDDALISLLAAAMGRKGGSAKSERKSASSRENGKKGGQTARNQSRNLD